jgi:TonB-dependent starch-binding outer membrane protein SusC
MRNILLLAMLCPFLSMCQPLSLKGKVVDAQGTPVPSATITLKPSGTIVLTNSNGEFSFPQVKLGDTLVVSASGFITQIEVIDASVRSPLTIILKPSLALLDDVVVTAYSTTTRRITTSSISRISATDIARQPVSNPLSALQGHIPGLVITHTSGLPGANITVQLRGRNSIQQGTDPLYIIDGVPFASDALSQRSGSLNASSPFSSIDPADIESIEVLKDADATAIYGSRGANGVILITTKKGKSGLPAVEVNYYTSLGRITRSLPFLNTAQYLQMRREAFANDGASPTSTNAPDLVLWDSFRYTNLPQQLIGGAAHTTNINTRLSGGSASTSFSLGLGYNRQTTVFPSSGGNSLFSSHLSLQHVVPNKKFTANISLSYASENNGLSLNDLTQYTTYAPNIPSLYDSLGKLAWSYKGTPFTNPLGLAHQVFSGKTDRLTANTVLAWRISSALSFKTSFGYNYLYYNEYTATPIIAQQPALNPKGSATFAANHTRSLVIEPQLEYRISLGKGLVQTLLGASFQRSQNTQSALTGSGYINDALLQSIGGAASLSATDGFSLYKYAAAFARINYNYQNRYILNLTGRYDGSSAFGPGRQFAPFGAIGAAWIFTSHQAVQNHLPFLSFGKLRGSYGITGNDQIGFYQYLDSWGNTVFPFQGIASIRPLRLFNSNYSWETNRKLEAAMELGFLKDRILLTVAWFRNRSGNQLISYNLPSQTGFTGIVKNFPGQVQNSGWEVSLTTLNIQSKIFSWQTTFNLTTSQNKLLSFPGLETSSYTSTYRIGQPLNLRLGYRYTGLNPQTGIYTFFDGNNDGLLNTADYEVLGTTDPRFYGGLGNNLTYKGFEASFFFRFVSQLGRHAIFSSSAPVGNNTNRPVWVMDRWQKPGDGARYQKFTASTSTPAGQAANRMSQSGAALTNASFIRLQNLSLAYTLPPVVTSKVKLKSARIYLQGQNLFTLTQYKGADPENQSAVSLPPLRIMAAGIQFTF